MAYPGSPQADPNEGYGYPNPGTYPAPPQQPPAGYPAAPFGPQPVPDQGTVQMPAYQPAPPMSGPPTAYGPISGPPTSGFPGQPIGFPVAQPPKKRGVAVPLLASLLALAVIAAGVFVGLWVDKSNQLDASESKSNQRQASLDQSAKDLEQTRNDLKSKADELTKAQRDLAGTETESTEAKRQRDVIGTCLKLLLEALDASAAGDKTTTQNKINEMKKPCNEAQVILGI